VCGDTFPSPGLVRLQDPSKKRALSAIFGQGEVFVHGEIWKAASEEEIQPGDAVEVTKVDGLALKVRKVTP
jgi:membrane-bound ClpP family serine protease